MFWGLEIKNLNSEEMEQKRKKKKKWNNVKFLTVEECDRSGWFQMGTLGHLLGGRVEVPRTLSSQRAPPLHQDPR